MRKRFLGLRLLAASSRDPLGELASLLRGSRLLVGLPGSRFGMEFWCRCRSYNTGDLWGPLGGGENVEEVQLANRRADTKFTNYNDNKTKYAALYETIAHCKIIMYAAIIMWARTGTVSTYDMSPFTVARLLAL